jgi:hypothetical protein
MYDMAPAGYDTLDHISGPSVELVGFGRGRHLAREADRNGALFKRRLVPGVDADRRVRQLASEHAHNPRANARSAKLGGNKDFVILIGAALVRRALTLQLLYPATKVAND